MPDDHATALFWKKSSASASGDCVEVALRDESILVRDSKNVASEILAFTFSEWHFFLAEIRAGQLDGEYLQSLQRPGTEGRTSLAEDLNAADHNHALPAQVSQGTLENL